MRLLIVDDEPIIRKGLARMAEQYFVPMLEIRTAENGVRAMEMIREQTPDVVFTDIRMPKMDGMELSRLIHEFDDRIQVVVISGYNDFTYAQKCMSYGVKHYLLKPVTKPDMDEILDKLFKAKVKGYISLKKYEDWIEKVEQTIWLLQPDELERLTQEWKAYCLHSDMNLSPLKELLLDCLNVLAKRLHRKTSAIATDYPQLQADSKEEAFEAFEAQLGSMLSNLERNRSGNYKDPMQEARAYIDNHLSQEVTLEEVAEMVGLTPTYFSSLFKKMTHETFVQYRIKRRIEKAQALLAMPHVKLSDVAAEVGYEDYPHFTKMFKKMTGLSPTEFRSKLGIK
ncbi:response regulator transcription factor [Paenibacillus rigui]|uniref:DNA-binding response regulator n=1 Tax=Paenibacillus rigui TaxID=554312 RepID=A0A229UWI5_9BACL|nr:response regulator [Paenibacillus rigui]OXM87812.1 DNA-binding response regulator [Paenibacillus rigui]